MDNAKQTREKRQRVVKFFADVFRLPPEDLRELGELQAGAKPKMAAVLALQNQPEFWADAPWRLGPDQDSIPVSFHVRDANLQAPGKGPWRLDMLRVEQRLADGSWHKLAAFLPTDLAGHVDAQGHSLRDFWVFGIRVPLHDLQEIGRGDTVHLRAVFGGSFPPHAEPAAVEVHHEVLLASHALPQGRNAPGAGSRHWFYGDTHYHSGYTNDVKEFGGAVSEARKAAEAVGLDWLIITDHSCDLDDVDAGSGGLWRWERLKTELALPEISGDTFRCILGEEITLLGKSGKPLHMLAFGSLRDMVRGAFLQSPTDNPEIGLVRRAIEKIIAATRGYPDDIPQRLFGTQHRLDDVLQALPPETLTFAAHPFDFAQVPAARWTQDDLTRHRLTGWEFWNGRVRVSARATFNPFETKAWRSTDKRLKADAERIRALCRTAEKKWDVQLRRGVDEWTGSDERPAWRPVLIGGSDAHGDFNYHVGWAWDYRSFDANDDALGRVRTAVHLPDFAGAGVPPAEQILAAIKKGSCVATDGPIVELWMGQAGRAARLGDVLLVSGTDDVSITAVAHTTPEFGPVEQVDVVSYFQGDGPRRTRVRPGAPATLPLGGGVGYVRLEAQTKASNGEGFCCFTNPIFVRSTDSLSRQVQISFRP